MLNNLFKPLTVKNVVIPNRATVSAMVTNYCNPDGTATERYLAYHEAKAKGGWGLIITEDYAITPAGKGFSNVAGLWCDEQIKSHSELPKRVHQYGSIILAQIYHAGRQTSSPVTKQIPVAPSPVPDPFSYEIPRELTISEIEEIIEQFGDCAYRAKTCGFDGIELHGAHGYLIAEFMSSYSNKRTDQYGGRLENRLRFPLEVIHNVRKKCGADFIIDFRISGDEFVPGGRTIEDTKTIVPILVEAGIDMIHVSAGVYESADAIVPPQAVRHGWITDFAAEVKKLVSIPVITVGRINDPKIADQVLRSGKADLVVMARASLCDPELPNKAKEGRFEDIRQCIGCNWGCLGILFADKPIRCVLNPTLGRESEYKQKKATSSKNVAVVGGGPAGMQAAITAAEQGHTVHLYEKSSVLGGQFRLAAVPPDKGDLAAFINWQENQLRKLNVAISLNTAGTPEILTKEKPDVVILATGAVPITPKIPGADLPNVVQANDVLSGKVFLGRKIVVIGGGQVGSETADYLAILGKSVTIVEMLDDIALADALAPRIFLLKALEDKKVNILTKTTVKEIKDGAVIVDDGSITEIKADNIVMALGSKPENALKSILEEKGLRVIAIGDAAGVRQVIDATTEGYETAMQL
ncbi:MAG TPA: NADH:flavin oxidoreductase [Firmicutes bacterium]|jgi:2,4-dienoyl-CoA reductase-like NADH-dependent reductase (Old Yellow Enzyme family)/thioredoxin reductase|nr:NADH:flavin oxidoreductase [Bacillota bacterium]